MNFSLTNALEATVSADQKVSVLASEYLQNALALDFTTFLSQLAIEISNESNSDITRMAASLFLKNQLTTKDEKSKKDLNTRWLQMPQSNKKEIKNNLLKTLATSQVHVGRVVAQAISSIAQIELPVDQWPELIDLLLLNSSKTANHYLQQATLETLGYICEEINPDVLEMYANKILTAVVDAISRKNGFPSVRIVAMKALFNSLGFIEQNFKDKNERDIIMQSIIEASQDYSNEELIEHSLQCLVSIMDYYYSHMSLYMDNIFKITLTYMQSENERIALQAIEFWSTVCEQELDLQYEAEQAKIQNTHPETESKHYALGALKYLIEILVVLLTYQDEDNDEYTRAKGAFFCINLLAQTVKDAILDAIFPFISSNINNSNWRYREAATVAFGSILNGPSIEKLTELCKQGSIFLFSLLNDVHPMVKDSAAWAIGKVCEVAPEVILNSEHLKNVMSAFFKSLCEEPNVAVHICWCLKFLFTYSYRQTQKTFSIRPDTYPLSPYYKIFVEKLLEITQNYDPSYKALRCSAYDTLMSLCANTPSDCYEILRLTTHEIIQRLKLSINWQENISDVQGMSNVSQLQSLICATLSDIIVSLEPHDVTILANDLLNLLLYLFKISYDAKQYDVQDDSLLALNSLIQQLGEEFGKYIPTLFPFMLLSFGNHREDYLICQQFCSIISDLSSSTGSSFINYWQQITKELLRVIQDPQCHRNLFPSIITCFADISILVGVNFSSYASITTQIAMIAAESKLDALSIDELKYFNNLRESCLEYIGAIILALRGCDRKKPNPSSSIIIPYIPKIMSFIHSIATDRYSTDILERHSISIIGDLFGTFPDVMIPLLCENKKWIKELVKKCECSDVSTTKELCSITYKLIRKYISTQNTL